MNTPAHIVIGAAAFAKPGASQVTAAALLGGLLPDMSLYLMAGWHLVVLGTSADTVFRELYYSDLWQSVFAVDNSFVLWVLLLAFSLWRGTAWLTALCGAALLHLLLDFPFHTHDARMHFWPITDWKFHSPVSYWDTGRGGDIVGLVEGVLVLGLSAWLIWRFKESMWKWVFAGLALLQIAPFFVWRLVF